MAEFLIKIEHNWMRTASIAKKTDAFLIRADKQAEIGDVWEVYPDGRCTEPPSPKSKFIIIKIPGVSVKEAELLMTPRMSTILDVSGHPEMLNRRRYQFDLSQLEGQNLEDIDKKRMTTITGRDLYRYFKDKKTGAELSKWQTLSDM